MRGAEVLMNMVDRMVNPTHRYVATAVCPLGGNADECAALEERIFDYEAAAAAALVEHLAAPGCHTQAELARVVGAVPTNVKSFRLVHEDRGGSSGSRLVISDGAADYASMALRSPEVLQLAPKGEAA